MLESDISDENLKKKIDDMQDDRIRFLWDATYFYMESPGHIEAMKETYNCNKKRPLTKAHLHVSTNGYIIDVWKVL